MKRLLLILLLVFLVACEDDDGDEFEVSATAIGEPIAGNESTDAAPEPTETVTIEAEEDVETLATTYYVATTGNDGNAGTSSSPWATIQHAVDTVSAGDTILVRAGVYNEAITINGSGSAGGGHITLKNYPNETPIVDGTGLAVPDDQDAALFLMMDVDYWIIEGLEIRNYTTTNPDAVPMGVFIAGTSDHIQLLNNNLHHIENNGGSNGNAHGIAVFGWTNPDSVHDILIEGNDIHDLKLGNSESVVMNGNVENFTIANNTIHDNDNIGIDIIGFEGLAADPFDQARDGWIVGNTVYNIDSASNPAYTDQSAGGIYVDGGTRILIERNRVYNSNIGIEIASEHAGRATSFITVQNNLVYSNHIGGLAMGGYDTNRGSTENCTVVNNTFYHNDSNQDGNGELWVQFDTKNTVIKNNIFVANSQGYLITNPYTQNSGNVVDFNLYFSPNGANLSEWFWKDVAYVGFGSYQTGSGNDANGLFADPLFTNAANGDFTLQSGSPAIGMAEVGSAAGEDFAGISRDTTPDIGAYEFGASPSAYLPLLTISADNADIQLSWANSTLYQSYAVWVGMMPYFAPTGSPEATLTAAPWRWEDVGVLGNAGIHHFYLIEGTTHAGNVVQSKRVGEFEFSVIAGISS